MNKKYLKTFMECKAKKHLKHARPYAVGIAVWKSLHSSHTMNVIQFICHDSNTGLKA